MRLGHPRRTHHSDGAVVRIRKVSHVANNGDEGKARHVEGAHLVGESDAPK